MNSSTVNFTSPETSTNPTIYSLPLFRSLDICLLSICFLFGLPIHSYMIWLIVTGTGTGLASEFFILNLSVCEIGISLHALLGVLYHVFPSLKIIRHLWQGLAIAGRPLFQSLICVERYLAVVHPVTFLKYKPLRYRVICCSVAWIITLVSCVCCLFILLSENYPAYVWFFSTHFLLLLSIQLFCLVAVLRALKQSGPGERKREKEEENHMKRRAFYLILITTVSISCTYVPYIIIGLCFVLSQQHIKELFVFSFLCFICASFVQPVLYLHRSGKLICFYNC